MAARLSSRYSYGIFWLLLLLMLPTVLSAADQGPGSKDPVKPPAPGAQTPPAPPSKIDPGIQKQPDTVPNPKAIVPPPVVDQNMVVDPEKPRTGDRTNPPKPNAPPTPQR